MSRHWNFNVLLVMKQQLKISFELRMKHRKPSSKAVKLLKALETCISTSDTEKHIFKCQTEFPACYKYCILRQRRKHDIVTEAEKDYHSKLKL